MTNKKLIFIVKELVKFLIHPWTLLLFALAVALTSFDPFVLAKHFVAEKIAETVDSINFIEGVKGAPEPASSMNTASADSLPVNSDTLTVIQKIEMAEQKYNNINYPPFDIIVYLGTFVGALFCHFFRRNNFRELSLYSGYLLVIEFGIATLGTWGFMSFLKWLEFPVMVKLGTYLEENTLGCVLVAFVAYGYMEGQAFWGSVKRTLKRLFLGTALDANIVEKVSSGEVLTMMAEIDPETTKAVISVLENAQKIKTPDGKMPDRLVNLLAGLKKIPEE